MQRFLFVGVGGSGGETLRYLRQELEVRLGRLGIHHIPAGWQFLHIDAPLVSEESPDLPALPATSYQALVTSQTTYGTVARTLRPSNGTSDTEYAGWLPQPQMVHVGIQHGAGQFRAIGRALTLYKQGSIEKALKTLAHRLNGNDAMASLAEVHAAMRGEPITGKETPDPAVVVVSSLAGGTGSGAFLDVCDILRSLEQPWAADSTALLYAPDVFQGLSQDQRQGIQANALASVSELVAGHWNTSRGGGPINSELLSRSDEPARRGPARSLIVGSGNGWLSFDEQTEVFAAVGRTLAAWAMSPAIQQQYLSYVWGNWQQSAAGADPLRLMDGNVDAPFSSLGYASVGLGREVFHRYAAQCLGRLAAERLLYGAGGAAVDDPGHVNRDTRILRRWPMFLSALGLDSPQDLTAGSLIGRLVPPRDAAVMTERDIIRQQFRDASYPLSRWSEVLRARIGERSERLVGKQVDLFIDGARRWVPQIEREIVAELRQAMLADGLPVAVGLVELLIREVDDELAPKLDAEAMSDVARADRYVDEIDQALGEEPKRFMQRRPSMFQLTNQRVENAVSAGCEAAYGRATDARLRVMTAALLRDLSRHLLNPLADALNRGLDALRHDTVAGADGRPSIVSQWPAAPAFAVPAALQPGPTQFLIDPVDTYPDQLGSLLRLTAVSDEDPYYFALKQVLLGAGPEERTAAGATAVHDLVSQIRTWRPELARDWSKSAEVEQTAVFDAQTTGAALLARAQRWCGDEQHALGGFIHQALQDALGNEAPSPVEYQRLARFEAAFSAAIRASAPLVRLDPNYAGLVGSNEEHANRPLFTAIPLAEGTEAYRTAMAVLTNSGAFTEELAAKRFDASGPGQIEMATFLDRPYHHAAFQSLTRPIIDDWREHRRTGRQSTFGHWRRTRSLPNAVPLSPEARLRMVRGFFVAFASQLVDVDPDGRQITILMPDRTKLAFPDLIMGPPVAVDDPFDWLGGLFESLPLAFVTATSNDEPLQAYQRLVAMGRVGRGAEVVQDLLAILEDLKKTAEVNYPLHGKATPTRGWELRRDIHEALDELIQLAGDGR